MVRIDLYFVFGFQNNLFSFGISDDLNSKRSLLSNVQFEPSANIRVSHMQATHKESFFSDIHTHPCGSDLNDMDNLQKDYQYFWFEDKKPKGQNGQKIS